MAKVKTYTPFMLVNYIKRPAPGQNTSVKNWREVGEWAVEETVTFVEELKERYILESHVVIDVLGGTVRYCSFPDGNRDEIFQHFIEKYREDVQKAISVWAKRQADRGVLPADLVK